MANEVQLSTGIPGLDRLLRGLIAGDNVVWQVDAIEHFLPFVPPYCRHALARGKQIIYFRFADHPPLVPEELRATVCQLDTSVGFEQMITEIHRTLSEAGREACFVFDCLSMLADAWLSDRMLGNFFRLTCPYVLELESLAYFPLLRNRHSFHAVTPIRNTTQILLDVYRHREDLYVHPVKVEHRYSPTMHMLHGWEGDDFVPLTESSTTAEILTATPWTGLDSVRMRQGTWTRILARAEQVWEQSQKGEQPDAELDDSLDHLLRMIVSRDDRLLQLAKRYLTLGDVLRISKRMIGTGLIGGKSVGMLLARAILNRAHPRWAETLEAHDSFYIGSDVFYSYLVENGCWWLRQRQHDPETFLDGLPEIRRRTLAGSFPEYIEKEFSEMLEYFGQSPIIVRSSSLLEDNYGNAFAGKYESVFCANQGPHRKRLDDFLSAVRAIYASTMSEQALRYRAQRGLLDRDEQMSLLVQRVSGSRYGNWFFPQVAGVGYSYNPYVWSRQIDPKAGMVRLVFGLGTRAVNRVDDDYTRVIALNEPQQRPDREGPGVARHAQRRVDVIDMESGQLASEDFEDVRRLGNVLPLHLFVSPDSASIGHEEAGEGVESEPMLTFDPLLARTPFVNDMREILQTLEQAYDSPVDLEFTTNFFHKDAYKINLLQCRPLRISPQPSLAEQPAVISPSDLIVESRGIVIGPSRLASVDRIVYVEPMLYSQLPVSDRHTLARLIGRVLHVSERQPPKSILLIGPGRWGTDNPHLGVPIVASDMDRVAMVCELAVTDGEVAPDASLGTHFFSDLVERDILYFAVLPDHPYNQWNREFFLQSPNRLTELVPDEARWAPVLRVIDFPAVPEGGCQVQVYANTPEQIVLCYRRIARNA